MQGFSAMVAAAGAVFGVWVIAGLWAQWRIATARPGPHWARPGPPVWTTSLPFLGGSEPAAHAWTRFHFRYYPMTLLLIAFEMEMMFMYPWAVVFVQEGDKALAEMGMFLGLLSVGIFYAHREGALRWQ